LGIGFAAVNPKRELTVRVVSRLRSTTARQATLLGMTLGSYIDISRRFRDNPVMHSDKSAQEFPYKTHLNVLYKPLEIVDVQKLVETCTDKWYNQTLCRVNDSVVRLGVMEGEYHWHEHKDLDEFFYVVEGRFVIDLEDRVVDLAPRQGFVVPKGLRHRTRAPERTVILMVEGADIIPTGD
jgi:mannose-6-phosphate isomerase-like protein (cupin superfamily)